MPALQASPRQWRRSRRLAVYVPGAVRGVAVIAAAAAVGAAVVCAVHAAPLQRTKQSKIRHGVPAPAPILSLRGLVQKTAMMSES